jgi:hypothetical protein
VFSVWCRVCGKAEVSVIGKQDTQVSELPRTGVDVAPLAEAGVTLVMCGVMLTQSGRKRERRLRRQRHRWKGRKHEVRRHAGCAREMGTSRAAYR